MYYAAGVVEELKRAQQIAVFGAGLVAFEVTSCLMAEPYNLKIDCFLVSDRKENPMEMLGLPVLLLGSQECNISKNALIVVAVMEKHLLPICENLRKYGFDKIISMTFESDLWSLIQGNYYRELRLKQHKTYQILEEELQRIETDEIRNAEVHIPSIHIYTAMCHMDRPLKEDLSRYSWEIPIQAGAALTKQKLCGVRDDLGENISHKNGQYCELTALYWIWKHDCSDYVGLGHYRRHFNLDRGMLKKLCCSDIDVVLTIPVLNFPSVREVYRHDHTDSDWETALEAIRILEPEYIAAAEEIQSGNYYYGYNMLIAKRRILDAYCTWLFPILGYCEEHCCLKKDRYQSRYIGFLAERLMGIYFLKHENTYKIAHITKHFVER